MPLSHRHRKQQTQLTFSPLPPTSPARKSQPEAVRDRAAAVTISSGGRQLRSQDKISNWTIPAQAFLPTPVTQSSKRSSPIASNSAPNLTRRQPFLSSGTRSTAARSRKRALSDSDSSDAASSSRTEFPRAEIPSSPPDIDSMSDSDVVMVTPRRGTKWKKSQKTPSESEANSEDAKPIKRHKSASSPIQTRGTNRVNEDSDVEDDDEAPIRSPRKLLYRRRSSQTQRGDDDDIVEDSDEDENIAVDSDDEQQHSRRRNSAQEKDDLAEDLEFLGSVDESSPAALRSSMPTPKQSARKRALDQLRKRRQQKEGGQPSQTQEPSPPQEESDDEELPLTNAPDSDDEDFIVEDDESTERAQLPIEFSYLRTEKASKLFKFVIEWMVQKKLNPGFRGLDEVYITAFDRLDSYTKQMAGSKYQSSVWTKTFLNAVNLRPDLEDVRVGSLDRLLDGNKCEACNRSGHPATYELTFRGGSYNKETLEQVSDDESDGDDDDRPARNETFHVGKFCRRNAVVSHTLAHWRYHLNSWVIDYLKNQGHLTPEKIVQRDGWKTSKRSKYANRIVDDMAETGEIKRLYRDFKNSITEAQGSGFVDDMFASSP